MTRKSGVHLTIRRADGFFARLKGLMFEPSIAPDAGLWITPCRTIHTFFMRFPIDAIFLDREMRVVKLCPDLRPNRIGAFCFGATSVLECESGFIARTGIVPGCTLEFDEKSNSPPDVAGACFKTLQ